MALQSGASGAARAREKQGAKYWSGSKTQSFEAWVDSTSRDSINANFEQLLKTIRDTGLEHYHLRLGPTAPARLGVSLKFDEYPAKEAAAGAGPDAGGPLEADACMSCDLDARLAEGVLGAAAAEGKGGPTAKDSLVKEIWKQAQSKWSPELQNSFGLMKEFASTLPAENRGTHAAFLLHGEAATTAAEDGEAAATAAAAEDGESAATAASKAGEAAVRSVDGQDAVRTVKIAAHSKNAEKEDWEEKYSEDGQDAVRTVKIAAHFKKAVKGVGNGPGGSPVGHGVRGSTVGVGPRPPTPTRSRETY
eukprot:gene11522-34234_t